MLPSGVIHPKLSGKLSCCIVCHICDQMLCSRAGKVALVETDAIAETLYTQAEAHIDDLCEAR